MAKSVNEKLLDRYIRHAVQIERFKTGEAKRISNHLGREVFPELIDKLMDKLKSIDPAKLKKSWAIKRLKGLTASVDKLIIVGVGKAEEAMVGNLMDLSDMEVDWTKLTIERTVPLDIDMTMPSTEVLRQTVLSTRIEDRKLSAWLKGYKKSVRMDMMRSVSKGISAGESIPQIGRRLRSTANKGRKQAEHIARTAVSSIVNKARQAVYEKNTDLVKGVLYVATLDTRTTLICINLDGQRFPVGEGSRPPMHFNCRSTTIPVIASWKEFGIKDPPPATRASMTGAVPAKTTYKQWLKKQPASIQDKVLGKTRGRLYRSGEVKIDKFISKDYKPLTLKQLGKAEGIEMLPIKQERLMAMKSSFINSVDADYTKVFTKEFDSLATQFPEVAAKIKSVDVFNKSSYVRKFGKGSIANAGKSTDKAWKIAFNGDYFGKGAKWDLPSSLKGYKKRNILASSKVDSTLTHEFGHMVRRSLPKNKQKKIFDLFFDELNDFGGSHIESQVSKYASTSSSEMFAECFVQWRAGTMSAWSKKVMKIAGIK